MSGRRTNTATVLRAFPVALVPEAPAGTLWVSSHSRCIAAGAAGMTVADGGAGRRCLSPRAERRWGISPPHRSPRGHRRRHPPRDRQRLRRTRRAGRAQGPVLRWVAGTGRSAGTGLGSPSSGTPGCAGSRRGRSVAATPPCTPQALRGRATTFGSIPTSPRPTAAWSRCATSRAAGKPSSGSSLSATGAGSFLRRRQRHSTSGSGRPRFGTGPPKRPVAALAACRGLDHGTPIPVAAGTPSKGKKWGVISIT